MRLAQGLLLTWHVTPMQDVQNVVQERCTLAGRKQAALVLKALFTAVWGDFRQCGATQVCSSIFRTERFPKVHVGLMLLAMLGPAWPCSSMHIILIIMLVWTLMSLRRNVQAATRTVWESG